MSNSLPYNWAYGVVVVAHMYNEAEALPWWIRHYQRLGVLRIRLMDHRSTDDSVAMAQQAGAIVESLSTAHTWIDVHRHMCNVALWEMTQPGVAAVVWVDCDEFCTPLVDMHDVEIGYVKAWEGFRTDPDSALPPTVEAVDWRGWSAIRIPDERYDKTVYVRRDQRDFVQRLPAGRHPAHRVRRYHGSMLHIRDFRPGYFLARGHKNTAIEATRARTQLSTHWQGTSDAEWLARYAAIRNELQPGGCAQQWMNLGSTM